MASWNEKWQQALYGSFHKCLIAIITLGRVFRKVLKAISVWWEFFIFNEFKKNIMTSSHNLKDSISGYFDSFFDILINETGSIIQKLYSAIAALVAYPFYLIAKYMTWSWIDVIYSSGSISVSLLIVAEKFGSETMTLRIVASVTILFIWSKCLYFL